MGSTQKKAKITESAREGFKKEYLKVAQKDFNNGMKIIKNTLYIENEIKDNWTRFLIEKFTEHLKCNIVNAKYIQQIINYFETIEEPNEIIHIYNLSAFLTKEIGDITKTKLKKQSLIDRYYTEEEFVSNDNLYNTISKDEMLWKGSEFIFKDLENINHPINCFINSLRFILSEAYEKEFQNLIKSWEKEKVSKELMFHNEILNESKLMKTRKLSSNKSSCNTLYTDDSSNNLNNSFSMYNFCQNITDQKIAKLYKEIQNEIITISQFIAGALVRFYSIKSVTSPKLFEIFSEKIKDLLIRKGIYNIIYKIKSYKQSKNMCKFKENLIGYFNIKPNHLSTNPFFSLDKKFRKFVLEYINNKKDEILSSEQNQIPGEIPFHKSILVLKKITEAESFINKIDIMYQLRSSILSEIDDFWTGIPLKAKYKSVDADNLLSIFIYLMIKGQIGSLIIDLEIIEDFANRNMKLSRKGYFFSLFQSSVEYLIDSVSINQIENNKKEYNNIFNKELDTLAKKPELILDFNK